MFIQFIKMTVTGFIGAVLYLLMQICRCIAIIFGCLQTQCARGVMKLLPKNTCFVTVIEKEETNKQLCKIKII